MSHSIQDPLRFFGEDRFTVYFNLDVTPRASGEKVNIKEIGLYTVEGGKVVREEFFYRTP